MMSKGSGRQLRGKALTVIGVTLAAAVVAAGVWGVRGRAEAERPRPAPAAVPVHAEPAAASDVPFVLTGIGAVQAYNTVTVHVRVDGELQQVLFREGQTIHAGDVLARIDPRSFQSALDQAVAKKASDQAQLVAAQQNLQRYEALAQHDFSPRQQLDNQRALVQQLQATINADQAQIDLARTQLSYTTIVAPIDGVAGIRLVDQGNVVHASDAGGIVVITQVQPIAAIFSLPANQLVEIRTAMASGQLTVTALSQQSDRAVAQGQLEVVDNTVDQTTGTVRLKAVFANADGVLWPGEHLNVALLLRTDHGVVTVPSGAVQRGPNGPFVYIIRPDQTAAIQPVQIARFHDNRAVIASGVAAGTTVVVDGQYRLSQGTRVAATPTDAPAQQAQAPAPPSPAPPAPAAQPPAQQAAPPSETAPAAGRPAQNQAAPRQNAR
jgi:multidrug efflux system membrane fusion protein